MGVSEVHKTAAVVSPMAVFIADFENTGVASKSRLSRAGRPHFLSVCAPVDHVEDIGTSGKEIFYFSANASVLERKRL
jgi:hypothetical protein